MTSPDGPLQGGSRKKSASREHWAGRSRRSRRPRVGSTRQRTLFRPSLERLEDRNLLATVHWINPGGGAWNVPSNWDTGQLPGPDDDVVIDVAGANVTVTHPSGSDTVRSLTSNEAVTLSGGTLRINGPAAVDNAFSLSGGMLAAATVAAGTTVTATSAGGVLDGVTLDGDLDLSANNTYVGVQNGLTLNGTLTIGYNARAYFNGTQTLGGSGDVHFANNANYSGLIVGQNDTTLTIGPGITVHGGSTAYNYYSGAVIGASDYWGGGSNANVVLQGKIRAEIPGQSLHVRTTGTLTNLGILEAASGGTLNAATLGGNLGAGVSVAGSTLTVGGTYTVDQPLSLSSSGTLNLGGTPTLASPGIISSAGALVNLTGTLENAGKSLLLNAATGSWGLAGGTITGGTTDTSDGAKLIVAGSGGTLDGVTVNGDLDLSTSGSSVSVPNGLTLNGTMTIGYNARVVFNGTQTLGGSGDVHFANNANYSGLIVGQNNSFFGEFPRAASMFGPRQ